MIRVICHAAAENDQQAISKFLGASVHKETNVKASDQKTNMCAQ